MLWCNLDDRLLGSLPWMNIGWYLMCIGGKLFIVSETVYTRETLAWTMNIFVAIQLKWRRFDVIYNDVISAPCAHYGDVIMGAIASQITSLTIVYSTIHSDADQRKHQSSASLAFVRGIHRGPVNSPWIPRTKGQYRGKCFHLMMSSCRWACGVNAAGY